MKCVIQRVSEASVRVNDKEIARIGAGLLILVGIAKSDQIAHADYLVEKCCALRVFTDEQGKMNRSLVDVSGGALIVSQFTLYGNCRKGRRPSFDQSAPPQEAQRLYHYFVKAFEQKGIPVRTGEFGAMMAVSLVNDGPVTLILDTDHLT